ncbi:hypothetical protein D3C78_1250550 [compost metagenome]
MSAKLRCIDRLFQHYRYTCYLECDRYAAFRAIADFFDSIKLFRVDYDCAKLRSFLLAFFRQFNNVNFGSTGCLQGFDYEQTDRAGTKYCGFVANLKLA